MIRQTHQLALLVAVTTLGCAERSPLAPPPEEAKPRTTTVRPYLRLPPPPFLPEGFVADDYPALTHLLQVTDRIYSGGEPATEAAFQDLGALGVRTLVSVDGAVPDVETAARHGMRYLHIPIGYDGISAEAGKSLARVVSEIDGPIYIHCHHGQHRGPAAAAVAAIASRATDGPGALALLERAGTSPDYAGLWRDVSEYFAPGPAELLPDLVTVAQVGSLAAAMAGIDRAADNLELLETSGWQPRPEHPDLAPSQEALLLREGFREAFRQQDDTADPELRAWLTEAEQTAAEFQSALEAGDAPLADARFQTLQDQCRRCHAKYRD